MKAWSVLLIVALITFFACGGESTSGNEKEAAPKKEEKVAEAAPDGEKIFRTYCITCHGIDGKLALNGAKDLSVSEVPLEERINQVTNGKGLMTAFEGILSTEQIKAVSEYTLTFKEQ